MSRNPYKLRKTEYLQLRIHKDLIRAILNTQKKLQKDSNFKFGNNKYKVSKVYASKILGGMLR